MFSSRWATRLVPGIGSITGERCEQPGEGDGAGGDAVGFGRRGQRAARLGEVAGGEREPRDEPDAVGLAVVEHGLALAVGQVVEVLHGGDRHDRPGRLDLLHRHLGQADVAHLALVDGVLQHAELLLAGHLRVDAVELPQVDARRPPRRRRLSSSCWRRYSGRPTGCHSPGPVRVRPALVAMRTWP